MPPRVCGACPSNEPALDEKVGVELDLVRPLGRDDRVVLDTRRLVDPVARGEAAKRGGSSSEATATALSLTSLKHSHQYLLASIFLAVRVDSSEIVNVSPFGSLPINVAYVQVPDVRLTNRCEPRGMRLDRRISSNSP